MANRTTGAHDRLSVTAAQPTSTGTAPAAPPITMFWLLRPLQPQRVDEDVEERGRDGQHGREQVDPAHSSTKAADLEGDGEDQRAAGVMAPVTRGRLRVRCISLSMSRSTHMLMALAPPGGQGPADQGGDHQPHGGQAALGHDHGGQRGDQQQLDDPRLGQRHVGPDGPPRPPGTPTLRAGASTDMRGSAYAQGRPGTKRTRPRYAWAGVLVPPVLLRLPGPVPPPLRGLAGPRRRSSWSPEGRSD